MHMLLRTLWIFFFRRGLSKTAVYEKTSIQMRVLPVDLDLLRHVNNGMYFSFMDFGRWNMIFSNGIYDFAKSKGWYSVVAGETIKFRRSLKLWQKFTLETQLIGNDEKYFYISQNFIYKGQLMASAQVKVRFLKSTGGTVSALEVLKEFGSVTKDAPIAEAWSLYEKNFLASE